MDLRNTFKRISKDLTNKNQWKNETIGSGFIFLGLFLLFFNVLPYFSGQPYVDSWWWFALICVIIGVFLKFKSLKHEFQGYWTMYTYRLTLALFFEAMMIYIFIQAMNSIETWTRIKLFVTAMILFFCILYLKDKKKELFEIKKNKRVYK